MLHINTDSDTDDSEEQLKKETAFTGFLHQYLYTSLDTIHALPGMDKAHLKLFRDHLPLVHYFIRQGATINELALVNINVLKKCFHFSTDRIDTILTCLTRSQLFSLNHEVIYLGLYYVNQLKILFEHGLTFENLESLQYFNFPLLKKCLSHRHLENILKFVSIKQILNIDLTPIPIEKLLSDYPNSSNQSSITTINHFGKGKHGDFSFEYTEHTMRIINNSRTDNTDNYFNLTLSKFNESMPASLKQKMTANNTQFFKFLHNWFVIEDGIQTESNELPVKKMIIFSPDLHCLFQEVYSINFPKEALQKDTGLLMNIPFYEEENFALLLQKTGCPINIFRALPGMTLSKLTWLCRHQEIITDLINYNIKISDFAQVEEERLQCILTHYETAQYALSFVSASILFGLSPAAQSIYSPHFFSAINDQGEKESKKEVRRSAQCRIC